MPRTQRRPSFGKSLIYYRKMHLAVVLGVAVTSAILTGALLVGDSVRGSLRELTLERLGHIEYSLSSLGFFRELLASKLETAVGAEMAPAIVLQGSAVHAESSRRTSGITVLGIDARFVELFPESRNNPSLNLDSMSKETVGTSAAINEALSVELRAEVGDSLILSFSKKASVNPEFILGSRDPSDTYHTLRVTLAHIVPEISFGRFSLVSQQASPYNIYLPLNTLQEALDQESRVNTLLVSGAADDVSKAELESGLRNHAALEDYGLQWRKGSAAVLESREMLISFSLEKDIRSTISELGTSVQPVFTYLANRISSKRGAIPYSTVSALDVHHSAFQNQLQLISGEPPPALNDNEILLNEWAALDLDAALGDTITLDYYTADWQENLLSQSASFQLKGIVSMEGLAIDSTLTPEISGVQDASDMSSWNPPIPIDLKQIRPRDEDYWDQYQAAPKGFLSYASGLRLWQNRFGRITSVRFAEGGLSREQIETALLRNLTLDQIGRFEAVRDDGLQAAAGSTDFGMLFIGFSFFLITSAILIVALLFRLGVENRARELGLLLSVGYPAQRVRRRFLLEGAILAAIGTLAGLALAWIYAWLLITGLQTMWIAAIGSSFLSLHIETLTLVTGFFLSLAAILFSLLVTLRSLVRLPATSLLKGNTEKPEKLASKWSRGLFAISLMAAAMLLSASFFISLGSSPIIFFGAGIALLISGLSLFAIWLRKDRSSPIGPAGSLPRIRLAVRNCARNPGRSLLSASLVASACFVIVAVGAHRSSPVVASGAGEFELRAQSDIALIQDLNNQEALFDLGFADADAERLENVNFYSFRLRAGEDISCRNLYRPREPRLLGVPKQQVDRGGFRFQSLSTETGEPWALLEQDLGPGVIPAFGDANSVMWILHLAIGDDLVMKNENGDEIRLRLVGLLARSIFQSELLISAENFERHFPSQTGYSYFLIDLQPEQIADVTTILEKNLSRYGFDVLSTGQLLSGFLAVENTYLSTFQSLGGLGLLLGTFGLGIILIRNTIERRGELATLQAFGFSNSHLSTLVLIENWFLLALGMLIGSVSALVAVSPHLLATRNMLPLGSLAATLLVIFVVGSLTGLLALRLAFRTPLLSALKEE